MASIPFIDPYDVLARITTSLMTGKLNLVTVVMLLPIPYKQIGGGQALVRWMRVMAKGDVWASAAMSALWWRSPQHWLGCFEVAGNAQHG